MVFLIYPADVDKALLRILTDYLERMGAGFLTWEQFEAGSKIVDEIFTNLKEASVILAVLNDERHQFNNNVSFEVGYAKALGRRVVCFVEKRAQSNLPFDFKHFKHVVYDDRDVHSKKDEFASSVEETLKEVFELAIQSRREVEDTIPDSVQTNAVKSTDKNALTLNPAVLDELLDDAFRRVRKIPGVRSDFARIDEDFGARKSSWTEVEIRAAEFRMLKKLVHRLRATHKLRNDWGFELWTILVAGASFMPFLAILYAIYHHLGWLPGVAGDTGQGPALIAMASAVGPLFLAIPAARATFVRNHYVTMVLRLLISLAAAFLAVSIYLCMRDGVPTDFLLWVLADKTLFIRGTLLGSLFVLAVLLGLHRAALRFRSALSGAIPIAVVCGLVFFALRIGLVLWIEPQLLGSTPEDPIAKVVEHSSFGALVLFIFVLVTVTLCRAPWLTYRTNWTNVVSQLRRAPAIPTEPALASSK